MKVQKLASKSNGAGPKNMPADLRGKLNGLTINEAIERGIIDDLGDANGQFVFDHADEDIDAKYALVQGYAVRVSSTLAENLDETSDAIGDLQFTKGISNIEGEGFGKEYFRLGMPQGIRLGTAVVTLPVEPGVTA